MSAFVHIAAIGDFARYGAAMCGRARHAGRFVLGLLVASAKSNYDRVNDEVTQAATAIMLLDRTLAQFGPQTDEARALLRAAVATAASTVFSKQGRGVADLDDPQSLAVGEKLEAQIRTLPAENEMQRTLQAHALELSNEVAKMRLLTITQAQGSIPAMFLVVWCSG